MEATQFILPAVATFALGTALLVPLRDDRRGRRATLGGAAAPLRPEFGMRRVDREDSGTVVRADAQSAAEPFVERPNVLRSPTEPQSDAGSNDSTPSLPSSTVENVAVTAEREDPFSWLVRMGVRVLGIGSERSTASGERPSEEAFETDVVERSFASELASLLGAANVTDRGAGGDGESKPTFVRSGLELARTKHARAGVPTFVSDGDAPLDETSLAVVATPSHVSASPAAFPPDDLTASAIAAPSASDAPEFLTPQTLPIVARAPAPLDRVVPITRLPLRPHGLAITWTRDLSGSEREGTGPIDADDRRAILERFLHEPGAIAFAAIERAYHEEEGSGRMLALRVLAMHHAGTARAVFVDALHTGTDDERALAVEGLAAGDAHDALPAAFSDRVEAIAARAALEFIGVADRATYRAALSPYVDAPRLDALLLLLAGVVE